ncbi:hypothetical protein Dimus_026132 [Dionaea muscipula]
MLFGILWTSRGDGKMERWGNIQSKDDVSGSQTFGRSEWLVEVHLVFPLSPKTFLPSLADLQEATVDKGPDSKMGITADEGCVLCHREDESRDHLFCGCTFSSTILRGVILHYQCIREITRWSTAGVDA